MYSQKGQIVVLTGRQEMAHLENDDVSVPRSGSSCD